MILQVNFAFDRRLLDAEALLAAYTTLTGWSEALLDGGADGVMVLQRFHHDRTVTRNGVVYVFFSGSLPSAMAKMRADVVHVNGLGFPLRTALVRVQLPRETAIVVQDHANGPPGGGRQAHAARRMLMGAADGFLFTSARQAEPWRAAGLIAEHQPVYAVPEASTRVRPIARDRAREITGISGAPALLWVGRLNANKDPMTVLDGFERCLANMPRAELTMVFGADDLLPEVRSRLAASPGLARRVRLAGVVPHDAIRAYYSAADIFVLGSHHEGSGYALIEACACGVVPVVTDIPAFDEITGHGAIGASWKAGSAVDFARALADVVAGDPEAARAATLAHFARTLSWSAVGARAMAIYADVARRRRVD